jgi:hypothetical protein
MVVCAGFLVWIQPAASGGHLAERLTTKAIPRHMR